MFPADLLLIGNPSAGRGRAGRRLTALLADLGSSLQYQPTHKPGEARDFALAACLQGRTLLGVAGGDGTLHEVVNGICASGVQDVRLALFPFGSANDYAYALGLQAEWWRRPNAFQQTRLVDVGQVHTPGGAPRYFINGLGVGFNCAVTVESRRIRWLSGAPLYTWALVKALWSQYRARQLEIHYDALAPITSPTLAFTLALGRREGNFLLAPEAEVDDGWFDYLQLGPWPRWKLLRYVPNMLAGRLPNDEPLLTKGRAKRVHLASPEPLWIHTDGEFYALQEDEIREVQIEILPKALTMVGVGEGAKL